MEYFVKCQGIEKSFGSEGTTTRALRGTDLDVKAGELLMLVGPSGCGKTTLISVVAGILNPDSGICELFGMDITRMRDRERTQFRGREIGFVFQSFNLIPTLSVLENVSVPALLNGCNRAEAERRAATMLERAGIGDKARSRPQDLSGGQQQRVAIARSLVHSPRLIVADEPTSALDHDNGVKVMELFREVALAEGRSLIIVTHDSRLYSYADRVAQMDDGRVVEVRAHV